MEKFQYEISERDNRTLKTALAKLVNEDSNNWDLLIPGVLFAYHTSVHASTKCTPFEVMYGRKAKLPVDTPSPTSSEDDTAANQDLLDTLNSIRSNIHTKTATNISNAKTHQKECYDRRHNSNTALDVGTQVYIKNSRRIHRMGSKLEPIWTGPYKVAESLTKGRVRLQNLNSGKMLKNTYHAANLKVFVPRSPTSDTQPDSPTFSPPSSPEATQPGSPTFSPPSPEATQPDSPTFSPPSPEADTTPLKRKLSPAPSPQPTKRQRTNRTFQPITPQMRKSFSAALGLSSCKALFFGRPGPLTNPRRTRQTKGDGNCYFRSISYLLYGSEENHQIIRDQVVTHMTHNIHSRLQDYVSQPVDSYLQQSAMQNNGVWATDAEIMSTASLLGIDIVVYTEMGPTMEWLTYPASFSLQNQTKHALYIQNTGAHFNPITAVE